MSPGRDRPVELLPGFGVLWGAAVLLLGTRTAAALFVSAVFHEVGHIAALRRQGTEIKKVRCGASGFEIVTGGITSAGGELAAALAGPAASLALFFASALAAGLTGSALLRQTAGLNLLLFAFNMLPASPLDGGKALSAACGRYLGDGAAAKIARCADVDVCAALLLSGIYLAAAHGVFAPLIAAFSLAMRCCNC